MLASIVRHGKLDGFVKLVEEGAGMLLNQLELQSGKDQRI